MNRMPTESKDREAKSLDKKPNQAEKHRIES